MWLLWLLLWHSGRLRRSEIKDGWEEGFIILKKSKHKLGHRFKLGTDYAYTCFCYLRDNPQKAGLVQNRIEWKYSSARDYANLRNGSLCNLELGREIIHFL